MFNVSIDLQCVSIHFSSGTFLPSNISKSAKSSSIGDVVVNVYCLEFRREKDQMLSKEKRSNTKIIPETQSLRKGYFGP